MKSYCHNHDKPELTVDGRVDLSNGVLELKVVAPGAPNLYPADLDPEWFTLALRRQSGNMAL